MRFTGAASATASGWTSCRPRRCRRRRARARPRARRRPPRVRPAGDIQLYDATLRDGMGGGGLTLTAAEKLRVVHALDELGVEMVEAGFPASNPKEQELFELLAGEDLGTAQVVAFGMTCRRDTAAEDDEGL